MQSKTSPRRRNAAATKAAILSAAQQAFAEIGYTPAGIRTIAALAGVDSALVQRYFGSKAGLFEAALTDAIPSLEDIDLQQVDFNETLIAELLHSFLGLRAHSMIVLSTNDAEARIISAKVLKDRVITPLAKWLGPPNGEGRAVRLVMLSTSFILYTRQVQLVTPGSAIEDQTSQWLLDALRNIIG